MRGFVREPRIFPKLNKAEAISVNRLTKKATILTKVYDMNYENN